MHTPALPLHRLTRVHTIRLLLVEFVQASFLPALFASSVLLFYVLLSQFWLLTWRMPILLGAICIWLISSVVVHFLRTRSTPLPHRLDYAYGWQSALITALEFDLRTDAVSVRQRTDTQTLIVQTPVHRLAWPSIRVWVSLLALVACSVITLLVPTPFDAQIAAQQQAKALASDTIAALTNLPAIDDFDQQGLQQNLARATDAQTLLATLTQAQTALGQAQTANQTWQQAVQSASSVNASASEIASQYQLSASQQSQLADALSARQRGDAQPLAALQDSARARAQALTTWQTELRNRTAQTRNIAPAQRAIQNTPSAASESQAGGNQASDSQAGGNQASDSQAGGNQTSDSQAGGNQTSDSQAGGNQASDSQAGGNQTSDSQAGGNQASNSQAGGGQASAGNGGREESVTLFVPSIDEGSLMKLPTDATEGTIDTQEIDTIGSTTATQMTYGEVINQATQRAQQAIESAQIPWTSEDIVRDYYRQLQGAQP